MKKLYVGNLSYSTTEEGLRAFFQEYSPASVKIITDKFTGDSRGFGFVEIESAELAERAISELNGKSLDGKTLTINEARPQTGGSGSGGGRSFGGGSRGGGGGFDRSRNSGQGGGRRSYR